MVVMLCWLQQLLGSALTLYRVVQSLHPSVCAPPVYWVQGLCLYVCVSVCVCRLQQQSWEELSQLQLIRQSSACFTATIAFSDCCHRLWHFGSNETHISSMLQWGLAGLSWYTCRIFQ